MNCLENWHTHDDRLAFMEEISGIFPATILCNKKVLIMVYSLAIPRYYLYHKTLESEKNGSFFCDKKKKQLT